MSKLLVSLFCLFATVTFNGQILASTLGNGLSDNLPKDISILKKGVVAWPEIKLKASLGSLISTTSIRFNEAMSHGLDFGYDAGMMKSGFDLYTKLVDDNGVDFGIQCLPLVPNDEMVIPVGLESSTKGTVVFSVEMSGLPVGFQVTFEDSEKGTFTTLTLNSTICTIDVAAKSKITGRFFLHTSYIVTNVVTTIGFSSIAITTATINGNIVSGSATTRGVVFGTTSLPDISGTKTTETGSFGTGNFYANLTGLTSNTTYYARAYMTNAGVTYYGNEVSFTTLNKILLTVTADNKSRDYGNANPVLTFVYSGFVNGDDETYLDVQPEITTTATTLSDAGIYDITLSGGTDANYTFVYVKGKLTIGKTILTVTADNKAITYGESIPDLTYMITGFKNGDTNSALELLPVAIFTEGASKNAGNYSITVSGGSAANYDFSYVNGELTVGKATLFVSAENSTSSVGTIPTLTIAYRGFMNGDSVAGLDTLPVVTTTATSKSAAGTYPITVAGGSDNNYVFMAIDGELTLTEKQVPILTWEIPATIVYGDLLGEKQLNAKANIAGRFIYSPSNGKLLSAVKSQQLTVTFIPNDTMNFNSVSKSVSIDVKKATLIVTANDMIITYGDTVSELSYTITGFVNGETLNDLIFGSIFNETNPSSVNGGIPASLPSLPIASLAPGDGINAGTYPISVSGGLADNYDFSYVNGKLIVHKAELTVSAIDTQIYNGNTIPEFTLNYRGFVKTDNIAMLDTLPVATTIANKFSTAGHYAIAVSGGSDNNYRFIYVDGVLTVLKNNDVTHLSFKNLRVFPNLFESNITVINESSEEGYYMLTNVIGKKVEYGKICIGQSYLQLSYLKSGIYLLHVTIDKEKRIYRLVKK